MTSSQTTTTQKADLEAVVEALRSHDRFLVTTHENPDGDALGSLLAVTLALRQLGKDVYMYLAGHAPLIAMLRPGVVKILGPDEQDILVVGGFAEVSPEGLTILADRAVPLAEVDPTVIADEIRDAEEDVADATDDATRDRLQHKLDQLRGVQAALGH